MSKKNVKNKSEVPKGILRDDETSILNRRDFLIQTALASVGMAWLGQSCKPDKPQMCLSIKAPDEPDGQSETQIKPEEPQVCLKILPPEEESQPCLSVIVPKKQPDPKEEPKPCLSVEPTKKPEPKDEPQPCLSIEPKKKPNKTGAPEDVPQSCLTF